MEKFLTAWQTFLLDRFTPAALIFLTGYLFQRILGFSIDFGVRRIVDSQKLSKVNRENRIATLGNILKSASGITVVLITLTMALSKIGINATPLIAGAGVLGFAVGFGAQTLVRDIVTGFFIFAENQFNVGDEVQTAGIKGIVKEVKLRTTILEDETGATHIIPNSLITVVSKFPKKTDGSQRF